MTIKNVATAALSILLVGAAIALAAEKGVRVPWKPGKVDKRGLKERLSPLQYRVTQEDGTERPFNNKYWDNKKSGIYVDIVSGEPLFSSKDKYDSKTGWPSFNRPLDPGNVVHKEDKSLWVTRTEVRSRHGDSHLGHVFDDGPPPTGRRYCINSAALRFIPAARLKVEGYGQYTSLFASQLDMRKQDAQSQLARATFAGGCFWCMEPPFEKLTGVQDAVSGYMGGDVRNPTYKQVSAGGTGHTEVVQVLYDPKVISYKELLEVFWMNVDPTTKDRQFVDVGDQYRPAIFYATEDERRSAIASRDRLEKKGVFGAPIVTEITKAGPFYRAEEYHQDYYKKNPLRYKYYRYRSGRDQYLRAIWGDKT